MQARKFLSCGPQICKNKRGKFYAILNLAFRRVNKPHYQNGLRQFVGGTAGEWK